MSRKVLVPVDLSDHSREVLEGALSIAMGDDKIVVLYVVPDPSQFAGMVVPHGSTDKMREELEVEAQARMKKFVDRYAPEASFRVVFGKPSNEIVRISKEEKADIVVIGSHQTTGWMDTIFSSRIRKKVSQQVSCTVEVVPLPFKTEEDTME